MIDRSYASANQHLLAVHSPCRLDGKASERLQGMVLLALATVTTDGRPVVVPVDGIFDRGASISAHRPARCDAVTSKSTRR